MQEIFENFVKKGRNQIFFVFSQRYRRDKKSPLRYNTKGTTTIQIDEYNKITKLIFLSYRRLFFLEIHIALELYE